MRPRPHVLVVGGGIAGLTLAAALDPRQVRVTLVEERPERAGAGTVLALWRGALTALDGIGVGERVRGASVVAAHGTIRDSRGELLVRRRVPRLCFAPRPELVAALESVVPEEVTRLTREVTDPQALAVEVGADLVVGADGVRSICRQTAFAGASRRRPWGPAGVQRSLEPLVTDQVVLRGHLDRPVADPTEWWGPGGVFGVTPGPRGSAWFCSVHDPGPPTLRVEHAAVLELARRHLTDWDPLLVELLRGAGGRADVQRILLAPPMRRITTERVVLIGDAAHGMAPNLGRGANEAILDGCSLAAAIHRDGVVAGPRAHERRRHLTGQVLRVGASLVMRTATAGRVAPARDRVLRMMPRNEPPTH